MNQNACHVSEFFFYYCALHLFIFEYEERCWYGKQMITSMTPMTNAQFVLSCYMYIG